MTLSTNPSNSSAINADHRGQIKTSNNNNMMATSTSSTSNNNNNKDDATPSSSQPPKKKPPIQHLLAGGTAGFVESSICHPLDTIKTRMQLRRQNTLKGRALGSSSMSSMRDVAGKGSGGALHRTTSAAASTASGGGEGAIATTTTTTKVKVPSAVPPNTTVRVKPTIASSGTTTTSTAAAMTARSIPNVLHDVGWQQRIVPLSTTPVVATTTTSTAASAAAAAATTTTGGNTVVAPLGPFGTARRIIQREGPLALYKGLTAVYTGIIPKMAIRFVSFEYYRDVLGDWSNRYYNSSSSSTTSSSSGAAAPLTNKAPPPSQTVTFIAGLLSGLTEAILVVTPAEVCKIRMQSQYHSLMDPSQRTHAKYKNVLQTAMLVVKEEGVSALYKGVVPTMLRQGCNQAVNFTAYNWSKKQVLAWKTKREEEKMGGSTGKAVELDHWQSLLLGGLSGGMGPLANNPLDVVKTRMQKQVIIPGKEPKYKSLLQSCIVIAKEEGTPALWKGITPRLMRIMPGQAITFMTYEAVSSRMEKYGLF
ncbi:hypothetical protein ACHAWU_006688 [Discostella pseudostelligera]|uniref:Mitochondrial carrier n=1 Tax=Discostella pseudostelligera TaxID=259834 RepID=A0ABD3M414_9STRA